MVDFFTSTVQMPMWAFAAVTFCVGWTVMDVINRILGR